MLTSGVPPPNLFQANSHTRHNRAVVIEPRSGNNPFALTTITVNGQQLFDCCYCSRDEPKRLISARREGLRKKAVKRGSHCDEPHFTAPYQALTECCQDLIPLKLNI